MIGVAASASSRHAVLIAGVAGLVAGALSMAAGEYVSVSSQRDAEEADIDVEKRELSASPAEELEELTLLYRARGLDESLARQVAEQLSAKDRLGAHLRDELGLDHDALSRPWQAAMVSAASFASLALVPIVAAALAPDRWRIALVAACSLVSLAALGAFGGKLGGASWMRAAMRVVLGGGFAMLATAAIGHLFGVAAG